jgi:AcrR family transcriptional regulator
VGRATLYRHFPSREDLGQAIHARAMAEAEAAVVASRPEEGPADAALERLLIALTGVIERYVVLAQAEPRRHEPEDGGPLRERVVALIARGQREGVFTREPSPELVADMLKGVLMGSCATGGRERGRTVARVLLGGLRTRG